MNNEHFRRHRAPSWIDTALLAELDGKLWHAADHIAWAGIQREQAIRPDAPAKFALSFSRSIGAISLFDLACPDSGELPSTTHWSAWLMRNSERPCFWLEISRSLTAADYVDHFKLEARRRRAMERGRSSLRMVEGVEAAHVGLISMNCIKRALELKNGVWIDTHYPNSER